MKFSLPHITAGSAFLGSLLLLVPQAIGAGNKKMPDNSRAQSSEIFQPAPGVLKKHFAEAVSRFPIFKEAEGVMWSPRLTPAFPKSWPPNGHAEVVIFAYAGGMKIGLVDAEQQSSPWGMFLFTTPVQSDFSFVTSKVENLGPQGVRPIGKEEIAKLDKKNLAAQELAKLVAQKDPGKPSSDLQEFYCLWTRLNGTIRSSLPGPTQGFLKWVGCP